MDLSTIYSLFLQSKGVTTDTRDIKNGTLFFALKGDNFNGNKYAEEALKKGAIAAIVEEKEYLKQPNILLVDDVLICLQELATYHRKKLDIPVIGLTGSNGKTTTKELINAVLERKYHTLYTYGNLNNHIGVPLTLLRLTKSHDLAIIEMGANHIKEIELLCQICQPNIGYITNFGKAHLEGFGGFKGILQGKSELYDYLRSNQQKALINLDDPLQVKQSQGIETLSFDLTKGDYTIQWGKEGDLVHAKFQGTEMASNLTGKYNFNNLSAAIAFGAYFGVKTNEIKKGIEGYTPRNNRSQLIQHKGMTVLMDAYNANPSSMEASLTNFATFKGSKTVVLGDMFELGDSAQEEHENTAKLAVKLGFEYVFLLGENFNQVILNKTQVHQFITKEEFLSYIKTQPIETENILIKGSRGMALESILKQLVLYRKSMYY